MYKFVTNFNYYFFHIFHCEIKHEKNNFLYNFYSFLNTFQKPKIVFKITSLIIEFRSTFITIKLIYFYV